MSKVTCSNCGRTQGFLSGGIEAWYDCPKCGVICNSCDKGSTIGAMLGGSKKCPKCKSALKPRIQKNSRGLF